MLSTGLMQNTSTIYSPCKISDGDSLASGDSIAALSPEDTVVLVPLKDFAPKILLNKPENLTGSLIYTIIFLIIFAVIRLRGKNLFPLLFQVVAKKKRYEIILNEGIVQNLVYYLLSLFLSFSILSIALTYLTRHNFDLHQILYILGFLTGWHLLLICMLRLCSWIFNAKAAGEEGIVNLWVYHIVGGLLISPFVLASFFVKAFAVQTMMKIIVMCLILFYLVKFTRWVGILFAYKVPIFYMILYLCALEVIPLLVLYKLLV